MNRGLLWVFFAIVAALVVILAIQAGGAEGFELDAGAAASLIALSILGALMAPAVLGSYRGRAGEAAQAALAWLGIVALLAVVYTYRFEFEAVGRRVMANFVPGAAESGVTGANEVTIPRGRGGTYRVAVTVNGARPVSMIVDTGASAVVLTDQDARRAGIPVDRLAFDVPVMTANGQAMTAVITLDSVAIGPIRLANVRAMVSRPGALSESLLGHTFLDRLDSYAVQGGRMVLHGRG